MLKGNWIIAARNWLGLTQEALAEALGQTRPTVAALEKDPAQVSRDTLDRALDYFYRRGLGISEAGIKVLAEPRLTIEGDDWYTKLLDDVEWSGGNELLVEFADDRVTPPEVLDRLRRLRARGLRFRVTVDELNTHIAGRLDEYRLVPSDGFANVVTAIYGDNVAVGGGDRRSCTIFRDADLARVGRARFNLVWRTLPAPQKTTAPEDERF